jgi:hypothetical protein
MSSPLNSVLRKTISPSYDDNPNPIAGASWPQYLKNAMVITPPRSHITPNTFGGYPILIMPKQGGQVFMPSALMVGSPSQSVSNPAIRLGYASNQCFELSQAGSHIAYFGNGTAAGTKLGYACKYHIRSDGFYGFSSTSSGTTLADADTALFRVGSGTVGIYNPTTPATAQTFELYNTWTSTTSFENLRFRSVAGAAYQIGSAIGSAGGTTRPIEIGHTNSAGAFTSRIHITAAGNVGISHGTAGYLRDIFQVNTTSTSTSFGSGSIAPQGITITNSTNTVNRPIGLQFSGYEGWGFGGIYGTMTSGGGNTYGRISIVLRSASGGSYSEVCRWDENACMLVTPWLSTSGSPSAFVLTDAAHTTMTASTEATSVNFNLSSTKQFATGALTTQRAMRIQAPTYSFVGASTITTASTLSISGPPIAGTNASITNKWALNVESGHIRANNGISIGTNYTNSAINLASFQWISWNNVQLITAGNTYDGVASVSFGNCGIDSISQIRPVSNSLTIRAGTNAQTFSVNGTWTSSSAYELINIKGKASANFEIGPESGSAGGTLRGLTIGGYPAGASTIVGWAQFRPNTSTGVLEAFYLGPIADSTVTGGNARGTNSVDLQTVRTSASQVCVAQRSVIGGGERNTIEVFSSVSVIGGGYQNSITGFGYYSVIAGGYLNTLSGSPYSVIGGGRENTVTTEIGIIPGGVGASTTRYCQESTASGMFAAAGDAQTVRLRARIKTTDATPSTLMLDGSAKRFTIPSGKIMFCDILVSGIKSDGSAAACYKRKVAIKNVGGTTSLVGTVEAIGTDIEDDVLTDVVITADNTNDALDISVTGIAGETWRWVAVVEGLEIAYGT